MINETPGEWPPGQQARPISPDALNEAAALVANQPFDAGTILGRMKVTTTAEVVTAADKLAAARILCEHYRDGENAGLVPVHELAAVLDGDPQAMSFWSPSPDEAKEQQQ